MMTGDQEESIKHALDSGLIVDCKEVGPVTGEPAVISDDDDSVMLSCDMCNQILMDKASLDVHTLEAHPTCPVCHELQTNEKKLRKHISLHDRCTKCGIMLQASDMQRHLLNCLSQHTQTTAKRKHIFCRRCGEMFSQYVELIWHQERQCSDDTDMNSGATSVIDTGSQVKIEVNSDGDQDRLVGLNSRIDKVKVETNSHSENDMVKVEANSNLEVNKMKVSASSGTQVDEVQDKAKSDSEVDEVKCEASSKADKIQVELHSQTEDKEALVSLPRCQTPPQSGMYITDNIWGK